MAALALPLGLHILGIRLADYISLNMFYSVNQMLNQRTPGLLILGICMLLLVTAVSHYMTQSRPTVGTPENKTGPVVVVDAGHGGHDPGKIGINKEKEKDINLKIAKKLQQLLEQEGLKIVMTREDGNGLYQQSSNNKKVEDMRRRCEIICRFGCWRP